MRIQSVTKNNNVTIAPSREKPLRDLAADALSTYFSQLNGTKPRDLYDMVIGEVELPLLKSVMEYSRGNQSRAATILGINRGTLRKKLKQHNLIV